MATFCAKLGRLAADVGRGITVCLAAGAAFWLPGALGLACGVRLDEKLFWVGSAGLATYWAAWPALVRGLRLERSFGPVSTLVLFLAGAWLPGAFVMSAADFGGTTYVYLGGAAEYRACEVLSAVDCFGGMDKALFHMVLWVSTVLPFASVGVVGVALISWRYRRSRRNPLDGGCRGSQAGPEDV